MATEPPHVLVVGDRVDPAMMMEVLLKQGGHEANPAFDGPAAIGAARAFRPGAVLLDRTLPDMGGCEAADRLDEIPGLIRHDRSPAPIRA
jgi:two-component system, OmpR family, response regulator